MESRLYNLAILSLIDQRLDEYKEEFGDLPEQVKKKEKKVLELENMLKETENILDDVRKFTSNSKITVIELKEKEEKLSKQQFLVRNNKEFDAITKEIENIKYEASRLNDELRTVGVKEENLLRMLEQQKKDVEEAKAELKEKQNELDLILSDQNEEVREFKDKSKEYSDKIDENLMIVYRRIRTQHTDPVVKVKKNSCSGCFSQVPPQKIVEIRNNLDKIYYCENCGRILYPEELSIDETEFLL